MAEAAEIKEVTTIPATGPAYVNLLQALGFLPRLIFNPWYLGSGKFGPIVREGIARPHKPFYFRRPPPWYKAPWKLSPAQKRVCAEFASLASTHEPLKQRLEKIKKGLSKRTFK